MDPAYKHIEFCRDAETLWEKIKSGRWDWLGVHPGGQFVLGSPRLPRITSYAALTVGSEGAGEGEHGVKIETEPGKPASTLWRPDEAGAIASFEAEVEKYREQVAPCSCAFAESRSERWSTRSSLSRVPRPIGERRS